MTIVPIHDDKGNEVDRLDIDDNLEFLAGRVTKGDKYFYKGLGVKYKCHVLPPIEDPKQLDGYTIVDNNLKVFYLGPLVSKDCFAGKYGIFREIYQPQFTDFIGTCGVKELSIIENSEEFERSSAQIIKAVNYDTEFNQYYFKIDYKCKRVKYKENGEPLELYALLEYMVKTDWNFVWDKNAIGDVSYNGLVTDVGDLFKSRTLSNKLGTVYAALYSLSTNNYYKYMEFISKQRLFHDSRMAYVFNSVALLERFGVDTREFYVSNDRVENYKHIVLNYLVSGRNCGDCCFISVGDEIREQYISQTKQQLGLG
jgi:hypothetical protein